MDDRVDCIFADFMSWTRVPLEDILVHGLAWKFPSRRYLSTLRSLNHAKIAPLQHLWSMRRRLGSSLPLDQQLCGGQKLTLIFRPTHLYYGSTFGLHWTTNYLCIFARWWLVWLLRAFLRGLWNWLHPIPCLCNRGLDVAFRFYPCGLDPVSKLQKVRSRWRLNCWRGRRKFNCVEGRQQLSAQ